MDAKNEQRSAIRVCCRSRKPAMETMKLMHKAYTDEERLGDSQSSIGILRPSPKAEKPLYCFPMSDDH